MYKFSAALIMLIALLCNTTYALDFVIDFNAGFNNGTKDMEEVIRTGFNVYGALLKDFNGTIKVEAKIEAFTGNEEDALASCAPTWQPKNFMSGILPNVMYPIPLAMFLKNQRIEGAHAYDITLTLNEYYVDTESFYLGLDGKVEKGYQYDLLTLILHQAAHGLGFLSTTNKVSGELKDQTLGFPGYINRFEYNMYPYSDVEDIVFGLSAGLQNDWRNTPKQVRQYYMAAGGTSHVIWAAIPTAYYGIYVLGTSNPGVYDEGFVELYTGTTYPNSRGIPLRPQL